MSYETEMQHDLILKWLTEYLKREPNREDDIVLGRYSNGDIEVKVKGVSVAKCIKILGNNSVTFQVLVP
jgi:hypothetical protein